MGQGLYGFASPHGPISGTDPLERAKIAEIQTLAEELTIGWNLVRTFGTNAGPFHDAAAAKEMLRWVRRTMLAVESYHAESGRDLILLSENHYPVTFADIVLYQFLEFTLGKINDQKAELRPHADLSLIASIDCYAVDMTTGSGQMEMDVCNREVIN